MRTIDVVPTIAELLGTSVHWRHDGASVFSRASRERERLTLRTRDFSKLVAIRPEELERRRAANRRRWARLYGTGAHSKAAFGDPWAEAYRIGPAPELLDRRVSSLTVLPGEGIEAEVRNGALVANVSTTGELIPTRVTGRLFNAPPGEERDLAVAVNGASEGSPARSTSGGRTASTTRCSCRRARCATGANRLELFEVRDGGTLVPLSGP